MCLCRTSINTPPLLVHSITSTVITITMLAESASAWQANSSTAYHTSSFPPSYYYPFKQTGSSYNPASYSRYYSDYQRAVPQYNSYPCSYCPTSSSLQWERAFERPLCPCQWCTSNFKTTPSYTSPQLLQKKTVEASVPAYRSQENNRRPRKDRLSFTIDQLSELEASFARKKYISTSERHQLASSLGVSEQQVKTWYQNRRSKWKRSPKVTITITQPQYCTTTQDMSSQYAA